MVRGHSAVPCLCFPLFRTPYTDSIRFFCDQNTHSLRLGLLTEYTLKIKHTVPYQSPTDKQFSSYSQAFLPRATFLFPACSGLSQVSLPGELCSPFLFVPLLAQDLSCLNCLFPALPSWSLSPKSQDSAGTCCTPSSLCSP